MVAGARWGIRPSLPFIEDKMSRSFKKLVEGRAKKRRAKLRKVRSRLASGYKRSEIGVWAQQLDDVLVEKGLNARFVKIVSSHNKQSGAVRGYFGRLSEDKVQRMVELISKGWLPNFSTPPLSFLSDLRKLAELREELAQVLPTDQLAAMDYYYDVFSGEKRWGLNGTKKLADCIQEFSERYDPPAFGLCLCVDATKCPGKEPVPWKVFGSLDRLRGFKAVLMDQEQARRGRAIGIEIETKYDRYFDGRSYIKKEIREWFQKIGNDS